MGKAHSLQARRKLLAVVFHADLQRSVCYDTTRSSLKIEKTGWPKLPDIRCTLWVIWRQSFASRKPFDMLKIGVTSTMRQWFSAPHESTSSYLVWGFFEHPVNSTTQDKDEIEVFGENIKMVKMSILRDQLIQKFGRTESRSRKQNSCIESFRPKRHTRYPPVDVVNFSPKKFVYVQFLSCWHCRRVLLFA